MQSQAVLASLNKCILAREALGLKYGMYASLCLSLLLLPLSLSTQMVKADGCPPRAWFCSRFLPIKGEFFLTAVAKCLLIGEC